MGCYALLCRRLRINVVVLLVIVVIVYFSCLALYDTGPLEQQHCPLPEQVPRASAEKRPFELVLSYPTSTNVRLQTRKQSQRAGGTINVWRMTWQDHTGRNETMDLCNIKDICIASRSSPKERMHYFIVADVDRDEADEQDLKQFNRCLRPTDRTLGYKNLLSYSGEVNWVTGHTWGISKYETGNHPAAWHGAWSRMLTAVLNAGDIFASNGVTALDYFSQFQLLEESLELNGWSQFVMQTHSQAARAALSGGPYASLFKPTLQTSSSPGPSSQRSSLLHQYPRWADESQIVHRTSSDGEPALMCFKSIWLTRNRYYRSPDHAAYYRKFAYTALGLPLTRHRGCSVSQLQAVILVRNRPLWNMEEMEELMKEHGLRVQYETVRESTPYQDQVGLFVNADIVVSVHGSHLNNQVYMEPGSALIEVYPANFYHDEQARLAKSAGVWHIPMRDQPFPPQELIMKKGKEYLQRFLEAQKMRKTYPTTEDCIKDVDCRGVHRILGAYADMAQFKSIIPQVVSALTNTPGCLQAE